jgi:hypothetical protein
MRCVTLVTMCLVLSSRTDIIVVESSRTDLHGDVVDVSSLLALDVVERKEIDIIVFGVVVVFDAGHS